MNLLKCSTCKQMKATDEFGPDAPRTCREGRSYNCRDCAAAHALKFREAHREKIRRQMKIRMRRWRKNHPGKATQTSRERNYKRIGLDGDTGYLEIYNKQRGRCAVCGEPKPKFGRYGLHADHSHATGQHRGLVCARCNMLIGYYETAFELWKKVEDYLHDHEAAPLCE
jgi:Recombination endonuclease VII